MSEDFTPMIVGRGPRIAVPGTTGTYQIVFDNGAIVTIEKVELVVRGAPGKETLALRAYYKPDAVGEAQWMLKNERIVGVFLLREDGNP